MGRRGISTFIGGVFSWRRWRGWDERKGIVDLIFYFFIGGRIGSGFIREKNF